MKVQGIDVNFDRIMRITFWYGVGTSSAETVVMEYAPRDNEAYCPNMKVNVKDILNPTSKNGLPGYTAEITIVNPHPDVLRILANHITWILDYTGYADKLKNETRKPTGTTQDQRLQSATNMLDFYNSRVRVRVEAGYWNEGRRDYTLIFEGYVNSNSWYRKGTDNILVLAAYNIDITQMSANAIKDVGDLNKLTTASAQQFAARSLKESEKRSGKGTASWLDLAKKLVVNFSNNRPNPAYAIGESPVVVPPYLQVTEGDRANPTWYKVKPIFTPRKKEEFNEELWYKLFGTNSESFYTTAGSLDNMLWELCSYKNVGVNYEIDDNWEQGVRTLFVYPRGKEIEYTQGSEADIQIINYQNLLEAPAATADGSLNIKMLFNPVCKPGKSLALIVDRAKGDVQGMAADSAVTSAGVGLNDGISFAGSPNAFTPTLQGAHSINVYSEELQAYNKERISADKVTRGYLFNTGFPIIEATHTLETRGNTWTTAVKTIPVNVGIVDFKALKG